MKIRPKDQNFRLTRYCRTINTILSLILALNSWEIPLLEQQLYDICPIPTPREMSK